MIKKKFQQKKIKILENPDNNIYITTISFWEISLKFNLSGITPEELPKIAAIMDIAVLNIDEKTMASFYKLKKVENHKDPFDRIIIWHYICHNYTLISQDDKFDSYQKQGLKLTRE